MVSMTSSDYVACCDNDCIILGLLIFTTVMILLIVRMPGNVIPIDLIVVAVPYDPSHIIRVTETVLISQDRAAIL